MALPPNVGGKTRISRATSVDSETSDNKRQRTESNTIQITFSQACYPKPAREYVTLCGEDSVASRRWNKYASLSVADGLGGINDGTFGTAVLAESLASNVLLASEQFENRTDAESMKETIIDAYLDSTPIVNHYKGASTLAFGLIDLETGLLSTINLGDSAILVIRNDTPVFKTRIFQHTFNTPGKLFYDPRLDMEPNFDNVAAELENIRAEYFQLQVGDIIVAGSDGLFDNAYDIEIIRTFQEMKRLFDNVTRSKQVEANVLVRTLVEYTKANSHGDRNHTLSNWSSQRPFFKELEQFLARCFQRPDLCSPSDLQRADAMSRYHEYGYMGGKEDDISIIVGIVTEYDGLYPREPVDTTTFCMKPDMNLINLEMQESDDDDDDGLFKRLLESN